MDRRRAAPDQPPTRARAARAQRTGRRFVLLLVTLISLLGLAGCSDNSSTSSGDFAGLTAGQRVYDSTGTSLSASEAADLQQRLDALRSATGADVIVYVRALDADSDDTLDQVEALQQAWVAATGIDQDTAGAILINREPGTDDEARAGIFVGTTYDDGNVPSDEQEAIVEEALVPPLRDGNVAGSLGAGIDRLGSSIRNGPPTDALDEFAAGPGSTWLPWTGLAAALAGLLGVGLLFRHRATPTVSKPLPTTARPDHDTEPALATALVHGAAQASAFQATVLSLADRGALVIEQEQEPGSGRKSAGTVRIRLVDSGRVRGEVEQTVWTMLTGAAERDLISSKRLRKLADGPGATKQVVEDRMLSNGWLAEGSQQKRSGLAWLAGLGGVLTILGLLVVGAGALLMLVAVIPAAVLLVAATTAAAVYSRLSVAGRDAALPWVAYRDGLKAAGKNRTAEIDLDDALPDIVALGLGTTFQKQLAAATESGSATTVRAFTSAVAGQAFSWGAFNSTFISSSGGGGSVSGGGGGGGGGAAGST
ncbi:MAG: TPM domain-containing protein [Nakamurella sp.]